MKREKEKLESLRKQNLLRKIETLKQKTSPTQLTLENGEIFLNFSSNDYLGLSQHPEVIQKAITAIKKYGIGSASSRIISGTLSSHQALERDIATAKKTEKALTFSTGYMTNLATITSLSQQGDFIFIDELSHASLFDGAKLSSATWRPFQHNNINALEEILQKYSQRRKKDQRFLVVTEAVFSMDGDIAPIKDLVKLKKKYDFFLIIDEAHSFGILGKNGLGLCQQFSSEEIEAKIGTLSKAIGSSGGYVTGDQSFIEIILQKSRPFIYSTSPLPAQVEASRIALQILQSKEGEKLRKQLRENIKLFCEFLKIPQQESPIISYLIGNSTQALELQKALRKKGYFVPAIRYPTVPKGTERLRISLLAQHSQKDLKALAKALSH